MSFNIDDISVNESTQNGVFITETLVSNNESTFEGGYITESIIPATGHPGVNLGGENAHFNTLYLDNLQFKNNPTNKNIFKNDSKEFLNNRFTLKFKDKFENFLSNLKALKSVPEQASIQAHEQNVLTSPGLLAATESEPYTTVIGFKNSNQASGDSIGVGYDSGLNQANNTVAIGTLSGGMNQGEHSIAIGVSAGVENQNSTAIAVGPAAGAVSQSEGGIAVGICAGENKQPEHSVLIGTEAGNVGKSNNGSTTVVVGLGPNNATILYNVVDDNNNETWITIPNSFISCNTVNYYRTQFTNQYYFAGKGPDYSIASATFDDKKGFTNFKGISQDIIDTGYSILFSDKNNIIFIGGSPSTSPNSSSIAYIYDETFKGIPNLNDKLTICYTLANGNFYPEGIYVGGEAAFGPTGPGSSVYYIKTQNTPVSAQSFDIVSLKNNILTTCTHFVVTETIILAGGVGLTKGISLCYSYRTTDDKWIPIPVLESNTNIFTNIYSFTLSPNYPSDNTLIIVGTDDKVGIITYGTLNMVGNSITYTVKNVIKNIFKDSGLSVIYNDNNKRYEAVGFGGTVGSTTEGPTYAYSTDGQTWTVSTIPEYEVGRGISSIPTTVGNNIAMGYRAGYNLQAISCIAIGNQAGAETQGKHAVSIGPSAGSISQGNHSIAIGSSAGSENQNSTAIALGAAAGSIRQGEGGIALGTSAGENNQPNHSVLIGTEAGNIGQFTIDTAIVVGKGSDDTKILYNTFDHNLNQTWVEIQNDFMVNCNDVSYCKETNSYYIIGKGVVYNMCSVSPGSTGYTLNPIQQSSGRHELYTMYLGYYQNDYGYFVTGFEEEGVIGKTASLTFIPITGTKRYPYSYFENLFRCLALSGFSSSSLLIAGGIPKNGLLQSKSSMYILDYNDFYYSTNFNNTLLSECKHILVSESSDPSEPKIVFAGGFGKDENGINISLCYNKFTDIKNISPWIVIPVIDSTTKKNIFKVINGFAQNHIFNPLGPQIFVIIGIDDNNEGVITSGRLNIGDTITYDVINITKIFDTGTSVIYNEYFKRFQAIGSGNLQNPGNFAYSVGGIDWSKPSQTENLHTPLGIAGMSPSAQLSSQTSLNNIAVGYRAGYNSQSISCIAIGSQAGAETQGKHAVSIGPSAGSMNQGNHSIAIGSSAGSENQNPTAIAVGPTAGAVSQGEGGIAVGTSAGKNNQPVHSVLIGTEAGNVGKSNNGSTTVVVGRGVNNTTILYNVVDSNKNETWIEVPNSFISCNAVNYYTDYTSNYYYFAGEGPDYSIASATFDDTKGFIKFEGISQDIIDTGNSILFDNYDSVYIGGTKGNGINSSIIAYRPFTDVIIGVSGFDNKLSTCNTLANNNGDRYHTYVGGKPSISGSSCIYYIKPQEMTGSAEGFDIFNLSNTLLTTCYHLFVNDKIILAGGDGINTQLCYSSPPINDKVSPWIPIPVLNLEGKNIFTTIYDFTFSPTYKTDNILIIVGKDEYSSNNQGIITYGTLNMISNPIIYKVESVITDIFDVVAKSIIYNNTNKRYEAVGLSNFVGQAETNRFAYSLDGKTWIADSSINPNLTEGLGISEIPSTVGNNIAMGYRAGFISQSISCIAIGSQAGANNQGNYSIAIGHQAGQENQGNNSIIVNASNTPLNSNEQGLYINPIRPLVGSENPVHPCMYNPTTCEITYNNSANYSFEDYKNQQEQLDKQKILINDLLKRIERLESFEKN
jgi:hypothetical protein